MCSVFSSDDVCYKILLNLVFSFDDVKCYQISQDAYKKAAEFWVDLREKLLSATDLLDDKHSFRQLWSSYWASHQVLSLCWCLKTSSSCVLDIYYLLIFWISFFIIILQRFFRHLCMSAKVPTAVRLVKQALMEDKCVVIGLQSTGEARTEEAVSKYVGIQVLLLLHIKHLFSTFQFHYVRSIYYGQGSELDDFISGPRELLLKFVEEHYPLPEKPELLPGIYRPCFVRHLSLQLLVFPFYYRRGWCKGASKEEALGKSRHFSEIQSQKSS